MFFIELRNWVWNQVIHVPILTEKFHGIHILIENIVPEYTWKVAEMEF